MTRKRHVRFCTRVGVAPPRLRERLTHTICASEEVIVARLGVQDGQKCPFKDSTVAAIMLSTPCRVSGDHPWLTLWAKILLPLVSPPLPVGWDTALFAGKYPMFI
jgi:hypothetical protein